MKKALLLILFFFNNNPVFSQESKVDIENAYQKAVYLYNIPNPTHITDSLSIVNLTKVKDYSLKHNMKDQRLANCYLMLGLFEFLYGNLHGSLRNYKASLGTQDALKIKSDSTLFLNFQFLGEVYFQFQKFDSAIFFCNKAEEVLKKSDQPQSDKLYNTLGASFFKLGNYKQGINYFNKALNALNPKESGPSIILLYKNNIASAYAKLRMYNEAINSYKNLLKYKYQTSDLYHNLGKAYLDNSQYDSALFYLTKVSYKNMPSLQVVLLNNLALTYLKLAKSEAALNSFFASVKLNKETFKSKNTDLAIAYLGIGQVLEYQGYMEKALAYYQIAINTLHYSFVKKDFYQNPSDLSNVVSGINLFEALKYKANALYRFYQKTHKLKDLQTSMATFRLAIDLADKIRKGYDSDEAKLFYTSTVYPVFEESLNVAFEAFKKTKDRAYLEMAFNFAEKSKAAVLSESIRNLEIKKLPNISKDLLNREKDLKQKITALTVKMIEGKDSAQLFVYKDQIRDYEISLAQIQKEFEQNKTYFDLKFASTKLKLKEVQNKVLNNKKALLEYIIGEKNIFVFCITSQKVELRKIPFTKSIKNNLSALKNSLYNSEFKSGKNAAYQLCQKLVSPFANILQERKEIIVIPDGELNYIPFESFITSKENNKFLIHDFIISYAYSSTLLSNSLNGKSLDMANTVLAMAPFSGSSFNSSRAGVITQLPSSKKEVEELGGKIYLEKEATKDLFIKIARSYGIIHLATHAKADSEDPLNSFITFYPENTDSLSGYRLYTNELYNLNLDSVNLVVLSACETGGGKFAKGEGVMSLARAFAYAGCPNIIMSLWKADDRATAEIISTMHHYLRKGLTKDRALREAKLDYLRTNTESKLQEPYYWANFVFIGDNMPLYPNYTLHWTIGGVVLFLILLILFTLLVKRRASKFN